MSDRVARRAFLGGLAVTLGLPFFPSLPASLGGVRVARAAGAAPKRLLVYYVPNGVFMDAWMPRTTGAGYTLSETLQPLAAVKNDVLVVSGLTNAPGVPPTTGGAHCNGAGALLTCRPYLKNDQINLGKSVDQLLADTIGGATKLRSLELGIKDFGFADGPSTLATNISWTGASTPAPPIQNPRQAFDRLFQGFDPGASTAEATRRRALRASVLDAVLGDANSLRGRLGGGDQRRLDQYMASVRDVETRIDSAAPVAACTLPTPPVATEDFPKMVEIHHDLMALAFQCDATRVITFMLGQALGSRAYPFAGVASDGHSVTHHSGNPNLIADVKKIDKWRVEQLVKLVQRLKAMPDFDGNSVLSNTLIYYTSEIGDGNSHNQHNKPILLCGQFGGAVKTGRHIEFPAGSNGNFKRCDEGSREGCGQPQVGDLYVSILKAAGAPVTAFGDSGKAVLSGLAG
jgi:hypothetical protein